MVFSRFRKLVGRETMRDRLKPYLQVLEYRYRANEGTARKLLGDGWKKKRHKIVTDYFEDDKVRMNNPDEKDFEEIAELMFNEWYSPEKSTMEDSEIEWGYGPGGDRNLNDWTSSIGALKKRKKKTKRKRDKSKSNSAPKSASKKKPKKKKPKKKVSKNKMTKRRRR